MLQLSPRGLRSWLAEHAHTSMWLLPAALLLAAVFLSFTTIAADRRYAGDLGWTFAAGPEGARATLAALATTLMTVAGVAFSITIVVLQLSASQFSPRVVRIFLTDRLIQLVIGVYLGTFAYTLLVLRTVASPGPEIREFVPELSVSVSIGLGLVCLMLLMAFIHHVAHAVQASSIVAVIAGEMRQAMDELYPEELGPEAGAAEIAEPPCGDGRAYVLAAPTSGFLEYVDGARLSQVRGIELLCIDARVGDFVTAGDPLVRVWPAAAIDERRGAKLTQAFVFERERSLRQDLGFGFRLIADVGVRALSAGMNDPTTAEYCLNSLAALLTRLSCRHIPSPLRRERPVGPVIFAPRPDFGDYVRLAFEQIAYYGRNDARVARALIHHLQALARRDARGRHAAVLETMSEKIERLFETSSLPALEREDLARRAQELKRDLSRRYAPSQLGSA